jgi:hypothetical protein
MQQSYRDIAGNLAFRHRRAPDRVLLPAHLPGGEALTHAAPERSAGLIGQANDAVIIDNIVAVFRSLSEERPVDIATYAVMSDMHQIGCKFED